MNKLIDEIKKTGYFENIKVGRILPSKYKTLYNEILKLTDELKSTHKVNTFLRARVIFIIKYGCDFNKIRNNNGWLTFERSSDDFIDKTYNQTKKSWENTQLKLNYNDIYTLNETIDILKTDNYYLKFLGKAKNRTLIKENVKLYNSINYYTKNFNSFNSQTNKLSVRMKFLVENNGNIDSLKCKKCGQSFVSFNFHKKQFNNLCKNCNKISETNYPKVGFFKSKFGNDWEKEYKIDREKIKNYKVHSKEWFITNHGIINGIEKYQESVKKRLENADKQKTKRCSKISQELFWEIYNQLPYDMKKDVYFNDLNGERFITDGKDNFYFPDFILNKKIIEYDGKYWHNNDKDMKRNSFYTSMGYEFITVNENEYRRGFKSLETIKKCLKFLNYEN